MSARTVEIEFVQYHVPEMMHASRQFIYNFVQYSGIVGTKRWPHILFALYDIITEQLPHECVWGTEVLEVRFSGFPRPTPRIKRDGGVIFAPLEPRFVIEEIENDEIRPPIRTHVKRVIGAIAKEMQEVYRLRVSQNPLVLTFPKREYAKEVAVFNAAMLSS